MRIGLNITASGFSGKLLIRWLRASAPLAEVGRSAAFDFPYDDVYTINDLAPVVYIVQLWRSDDGVSLDQLLKDWSIDASKESIQTVVTYQYKVDRGFNNVNQSTGDLVWSDPENEDVALTDERLDGFTKDKMIVHEAGYGNKLNEEYDLLPGGGIELLGGKTFDSGVAWFITVTSSQEVTAPSETTGTNLFRDVETITASADLFTDETNNYYNKIVKVEGSGAFLQMNIPDLTLIPDGTHVLFNTHSGNQNYFRVQLDAGDTIKWFNQEVNYIDIPRNELLWLYFNQGGVIVIDYDGNFLRRGIVLPDYDATRDSDRGNLIYADESTGELSKDDYQGLYDFVAQLSGDAVCALGSGVGQWSYDSGGGVFPNKRKYGIDTVAFTFRVPHLSGMVAKYSPTPGVFETDSVGAVSFTYDYKQGKSDDNESGVSGEYLRKAGASGGTNYGNTSITYNINAGQENKVKTYSQKPFIYL